MLLSYMSHVRLLCTLHCELCGWRIWCLGGGDFWQPNLIEVNSIHMVVLAKCKVEKGSSVIC